MALGEEIKRLANAKGLATQQAIADASGLSQSFVARLLTNKRTSIGAEALFKLCDALGVKCDHFRPFLVPDSAPDTTTPAEDRPAGAKGGKKKSGGGSKGGGKNK